MILRKSVVDDLIVIFYVSICVKTYGIFFFKRNFTLVRTIVKSTFLPIGIFLG